MEKRLRTPRERLRALVGPVPEGQKGDKAQQFLWGALSEMCLYAARRVPEISDNVVDVDRAMRWGFAWNRTVRNHGCHWREGVCWPSAERGTHAAAVIEKVLASGRKGFFESEKGTTTVFDIGSGRSEKGRRAERRHHS